LLLARPPAAESKGARRGNEKRKRERERERKEGKSCVRGTTDRLTDGVHGIQALSLSPH
jgi:hypothetical protein